MWYFAWILGLPLAAAFAVLNAMWLELRSDACMAGDDAPCPDAPSRDTPSPDAPSPTDPPQS